MSYENGVLGEEMRQSSALSSLCHTRPWDKGAQVSFGLLSGQYHAGWCEFCFLCLEKLTKVLFVCFFLQMLFLRVVLESLKIEQK